MLRAATKRMQTEEDKVFQTYRAFTSREKGLGPSSAGQSGDTQGLSEDAGVDGESVTELLEEGQAFEAEVISGEEDARGPDMAEVHTRQVLEDDVPLEYLERD